MKFGLFGGAARGADQTGDSQSYRSFIDYVVKAEELGFESLFLVEHHFTGAGQLSASMTLLSYLAGLTSRMRLGTGVTVLPWHNPVLMAEQAATVDVVSNGRLDFGIGRGYRPNEFHGFIVDPATAPARFDEAIDLILKSWTTRDRWSHQGQYWRYRDIIVEPQPVQQPHPPIWVAAQSEASIRQAAARGQSLLLDQFSDTQAIGQRIAWYRDEQVIRGVEARSHQIAVTRGLLLVDDDAKRNAEVDRRLKAIAMLAATARVPNEEGEAPVVGSQMLDSSQGATEASTVIGTPEACIARLKELEAVGVDYVLFNDPWGGVERLRFFAREVLGEFSGQPVEESAVA
ncbi:LLM class flavin-dependent oxidoreductase [Sphingopyxis sp. DBS4]|jgi:alkanesulfonate monooxygenase SsuD/methylene tetrahydromethanopterin reductase-like flavin-dependent oxidoreductase (luciferase family)|uniref:LLM class flavin-dependent oxidoreductase n=1 Tax=Sphingopyxis sp. DBS4 TaxID=2968500 RepID=UPI00214C2C15|nr:LLM class flavin-dependent oxidoreductase [Sphingopyxis sp. DBS4]